MISIIPCDTATCNAPSQDLRTYLGPLSDILYNGPFDPQYDSIDPPDHKPPYQNFTVYVPTSVPNGPAALALSHWSLVGVRAYSPIFQSATY